MQRSAKKNAVKEINTARLFINGFELLSMDIIFGLLTSRAGADLLETHAKYILFPAVFVLNAIDAGLLSVSAHLQEDKLRRILESTQKILITLGVGTAVSVSLFFPINAVPKLPPLIFVGLNGSVLVKTFIDGALETKNALQAKTDEKKQKHIAKIANHAFTAFTTSLITAGIYLVMVLDMLEFSPLAIAGITSGLMMIVYQLISQALRRGSVVQQQNEESVNHEAGTSLIVNSDDENDDENVNKNGHDNAADFMTTTAMLLNKNALGHTDNSNANNNNSVQIEIENQNTPSTEKNITEEETISITSHKNNEYHRSLSSSNHGYSNHGYKAG